MKTKTLLLISLALLFLNFNYSPTEAKTEPMDDLRVDSAPARFGLIENNSLWLLTESRLYITNNNGELWKDISPEYSKPIESVHFANKQLGFVLFFDQTEAQKELFLVKTLDSGESWQTVEMGLAKMLNENFSMPFQSIQMHWFDENHGLLLIKEATSANFSKGSLLVTKSAGMKWEAYEVPVADGMAVVDKDTLFLSDPFEENISYRSLDGGKSWLEVSTPESQIQPESRSGGTLSALQTLDQEQVWAIYSDGNCESYPEEDGSSKLECELSWALSHSGDGGEIWENIPLPDGTT